MSFKEVDIDIVVTGDLIPFFEVTNNVLNKKTTGRKGNGFNIRSIQIKDGSDVVLGDLCFLAHVLKSDVSPNLAQQTVSLCGYGI